MRSLDAIMRDAEAAVRMINAKDLSRLADELDENGEPDALAYAHNTRGLAFLYSSRFQDALEQFNMALSMYRDYGDRHGVARATSNIGIVLMRTGENSTALEHFNHALSAYNEINDHGGIARVEGNIGIVHYNFGDFNTALIHYNRALASYRERGDRSGVARIDGNIGNAYFNLGDFPTALDFYNRALSLHRELSEVNSVTRVTCNIGNIYNSTGDLPAALEHYSNALAGYTESNDLQNVALALCNIGIVYSTIGDHHTAQEYLQRSREHYSQIGDDQGAALVISNIGSSCAATGDYDAAFRHLDDALSLYERLGDRSGVASVHSQFLLACFNSGDIDGARRSLAILEDLQMLSPTVTVLREMYRARLLAHDGEYAAAQDTFKTALDLAANNGLRVQQAAIHGDLRTLAEMRNDFAGFIEHNNEYTRINDEIRGADAKTKLAMQTKEREIAEREKEHAKHLAVLHSTLPKHIADRVARGEVVNDHYDNASVIFLDIVGFTELSSSMSSQEVIALLDNIFTQCDAICAKHGVTKIKTIGDSYMCVAFENVINAAQCAVEMSRISHSVSHSVSHIVSHSVSHIVSHSVSHEVPDVSHAVEFRLGIHCGPVTAGVIGKERMQYDVWGDTVNIASRMESTGEPGRVQVSEAFAIHLEEESRIKNQESNQESDNRESHEVPLVTRHSSLVTIDRGSIEIKGKGPMRTYWLDRA